MKSWYGFLILAFTSTTLTAGEIAFQEDDTIFPKPESGFYLYQDLANLDDNVATMRERHLTLLWGKINLTPYRATAELPPAFIDQLEKGFQTAQKAGVKVIVRADYGHRGSGGDYQTYKDPDLEIIHGHITQLAPLFKRNADRIAFFQAGFLGPWGEWHTTALANDAEQRRKLFHHLLEHTPGNRMVVLRYPALKQSIFRSPKALTFDQAFTPTAIARTGHHNDCFLSSPNDVGTYNREGLTMADEQAYLALETLYTPFGGETCALHARSLGVNAIVEMERLHASYLNSAYHPDVLKRWKDEGVNETITKRLGARFVLEKVTFPDKATSGDGVTLTLTLTNKGFAPLYNERPVVLVLRDSKGVAISRFPQDGVDPRRWKPGGNIVVTCTVTLPTDLVPGDYSWHLHLPDASPRLAKDPRFAIRFANKAIWNSDTGEHDLTGPWRIQ